MNQEPSEQSHRIFGPTGCGEILYEKIKDDRRLRRPIGTIYAESRLALRLISEIPAKNQFIRLAYLRDRVREIMGKPWSDEIKKRLIHCIKAVRK